MEITNEQEIAVAHMIERWRLMLAESRRRLDDTDEIIADGYLYGAESVLLKIGLNKLADLARKAQGQP